MIKTTDLRIGNIVSSNIFIEEKPLAVYSIGFENCSVGAEAVEDKWRNSFKDYQLEPIKLTSELLLKCGFEKYSKLYHGELTCVMSLFIERNTLESCENIYLIKLGSKFWLCNECYTSVYPKRVLDAVHELQNLYFALTGDELEIKL